VKKLIIKNFQGSLASNRTICARRFILQTVNRLATLLYESRYTSSREKVGRERCLKKKNKKKNREILYFWRESDSVENLLTVKFNSTRESRVSEKEKKKSLRNFLSLSPPSLQVIKCLPDREHNLTDSEVVIGITHIKIK
jgi:hypothetical protein